MLERPTNVGPDYPDDRDWIYRPALIALPRTLEPPAGLHILDQEAEGACTGFALAAAINVMKGAANAGARVSARMLYEMARRHDEWAGENYEGSSVRGAIHGWKNMGVCSEASWPYRTGPTRGDGLTVKRAKEARRCTLGAYYRLQPEVSHYHAALNESGVLVVSARVHKGWDRPSKGRIAYRAAAEDGGHAFAIVGYDETGFWVQNSWGKDWGENGLALWSYEDWVTNVMDGWVFRLALETPQIFGMRPLASKLVSEQPGSGGPAQKPKPNRDAIAGHFVHVDDGRFADKDRYWSTPEDVEETAALVAESDKYDHLLIYGHGGLNSPEDSARRIAAMKPVFKANRIYPFHIMYDTGIVEEIKDLLLGKADRARARVGGADDWLDRVVEHFVRRPGTLLWDEMKRDAADAFAPEGAGTVALESFLRHLAKSSRPKRIHLVGHSTGAILFAHLLQTLAGRPIRLDTVTLLAPACSVDLYHAAYLPVLQGKTKLAIGEMQVLNLRDELERDDCVGSPLVYRKSLLYLVSNAFEAARSGLPLLGMECFAKEVQSHGEQPRMLWSNGTSGSRTRSRTHGGFDNDPYTMNHVLRTVLGDSPSTRFTEGNLDY
ncbi:MAG: alpha/beta hydrolase [Ectothiorhodospiraceae bacterium]|nr:alpha/beta hydrolase [Ectothiorhodospiraceae bacterium]